MKTRNTRAIVTCVFVLGTAAQATAWELADCKRYRAAIDSRSENVTLEVSGGQPVAYRTDRGYVASNVRLSGSTIHIDRATLKVRAYGPNSFKGDWQLFNYKEKDVLFTCRG